jgi:hypothetical protein
MMLIASVGRDFVFANNWEAGLWSTVAAALVLAFLHSRSVEKLVAIVAFGMFLFADWLDIRTVDTTWSPWLFFAVKVLCFGVFAWLLWRYESDRRKHEAANPHG